MPRTSTERGIDVDAGRHRLSLAADAVRALAGFVLERERVPSAMLSIAFVSRRTMAGLNRRHLGHRGGTDVITFALGRTTPKAPLVGDIYVARTWSANRRSDGVCRFGKSWPGWWCMACCTPLATNIPKVRIANGR